MAQFQKGNPGRPEGSKNKNCMRPVFWWNMLEECLAETHPDKKIEHIFHALDLLMPKVPALPASPDDSVNNVRALLNDIEPATPSVPDVAEPLNGNGSSPTHS